MDVQDQPSAGPDQKTAMRPSARDRNPNPWQDGTRRSPRPRHRRPGPRPGRPMFAAKTARSRTRGMLRTPLQTGAGRLRVFDCWPEWRDHFDWGRRLTGALLVADAAAMSALLGHLDTQVDGGRAPGAQKASTGAQQAGAAPRSARPTGVAGMAQTAPRRPRPSPSPSARGRVPRGARDRRGCRTTSSRTVDSGSPGSRSSRTSPTQLLPGASDAAATAAGERGRRRGARTRRGRGRRPAGPRDGPRQGLRAAGRHPRRRLRRGRALVHGLCADCVALLQAGATRLLLTDQREGLQVS